MSVTTSKVFDSAVGARTDEDGVDRDVTHGGSCLEIHVRQGFRRPGARSRCPEVRDPARSPTAGHPDRDWPPGDERAQRRRIDRTSVSNSAPSSVRRRSHASTAASQSAPFGANGLPRRNSYRRLVGRDHASTRACFDTHVADGHSASIERDSMALPRYSDDMAWPPPVLDLGDDRENDVPVTRRATARRH